MRFPATKDVMVFLRERARMLRRNNPKVNEAADSYLDLCMTNGIPVTLLTQWCVSKNLERRRKEQGGMLIATPKERDIFGRWIPEVAQALQSAGFRLDWYLTFSRAYLDCRRVSEEIEAEYKAVVTDLARPAVESGWMILMDWEDEVICRRSNPDPTVLEDVHRFVSDDALALEVRWNSAWSEEETELRQGADELLRDVIFQIACEAEEGRFLCSADSPFRECLLVPLEFPEQYDFFSILTPEFKERIVPVLPAYPWRLRNRS